MVVRPYSWQLTWDVTLTRRQVCWGRCRRKTTGPANTSPGSSWAVRTWRRFVRKRAGRWCRATAWPSPPPDTGTSARRRTAGSSLDSGSWCPSSPRRYSRSSITRRMLRDGGVDGGQRRQCRSFHGTCARRDNDVGKREKIINGK